MSATDSKRYYWLKLQDDFFKRHDIKIVECMPNGKDYIIFYLKLLCESTSHEGRLRFSEEIPYNDEMLATITNTNIDVVRSAIKVLSQLKMLEVLDDGTLFLHQVSKMIGTETGATKRKRAYREQQKLLIGTLSPNCPQEIDIDIEIDKDKDIYKKHKYGKYKNVLLSDDELEKLKEEFSDYQERIERVSEYCASKGKSYKNYLATIRNWARKDKVDNTPNYSNQNNVRVDRSKLDEILKKRGQQ